MKNVFFISNLGKDVYMAWGYREDMPMATVVRCKESLSRDEIEQMVWGRFAVQFMEWKYRGYSQKSKKGTRLDHSFLWVDAETINETVLAGAPQQLPLIDTNRKPKIYEVAVVDGGLKLIKHDAELLDEDEAKLKLFERAVNG